MNNYLYAFLTILLLQYSEVYAACNECNTLHACVSRNKFSVCFGDSPSETIVSCPAGTVCTNDVHICQPNAEPSCKREHVRPKSQCGVCENENQVFACIGEDIIAFCFGKNLPFFSALATCPEGTVCDLNNKTNICSPRGEAWPSCYISEDNNESFERSFGNNGDGGSCSADTTTKAPVKETEATTVVTYTTPKGKQFDESTVNNKIVVKETTTPESKTEETTEETTTKEPETTILTTEETTIMTTTEEKPTTEGEESRSFSEYPGDNYKYYCGTKRLEAIYANIYDPTCETFIYCVQQNGIWLGVEMYCDDEYKYFDPTTNKCTPNKPAHCR